MGEERVKLADSQEETQHFMKNVLKDLHALEKMLQGDWFEKDPLRIGAEQELCLVDRQAKASPTSMEVLEKLEDKDAFTTEFAKFNLEINLEPLEFTGKCLSQMEENLSKRVETVRKAAQDLNSDVILTGILPTIRKADVDLKNMTPLQRYRALCQAINKMRGEEYDLRIQGTDELLMKFDSPLLEACNTGFQVHLQVTPENFVQKYNVAQAITAPVLACSVGSPILFGKRLWSETRIALFQQSVDTRQVGDHLRDSSPRVTFGNEWVSNGILDIFREDTARYRVLLSSEIEEDVDQKMAEGTPPMLAALQVHNGTVYRWNRPCYGISEGKAHLRIENRVFPSGPTVTDEVANSAFWLGLMNKLEDYYPDIPEVMDFDQAKMNFVAASKMGLDTNFRWFNDKRVSAADLITEELLPIAREGLEKANIRKSDIDTYLDIIEERVVSGQTFSHWMTENYASLLKQNSSKELSLAAMTTAMIKYQKKGEPVHQWGRARMDDLEHWEPSSLLVEEFMTTDLFTVQKDDILEFTADLIEWRRIRYVPVEDDKKHLVGLVTMRMIFREYNSALHHDEELHTTVEEIMIKNPITIHPEASIIEAMDIMESQKIGCLPVVKNNRLVGIITETNYMTITGRLLRVVHANANKKDE
ncbi:glutamate-cysteine ligase family protein [Aliifodinibius sp. S!AR15-10]|uniref:glutamate-cysteine ligase family protein n=1 Tax=Aliifodinibius sp. S!AR15-10 TaxID=2950437 RepID=UPI002862996A|nr:glutamate-cysteine ligase family protein [Aliifodinibius sp. S!AR15-10]MDR8392830.1 glutamate-cysteine ligase family protein [Aliifodinibius sp. S!AR15-10]